MVALRASADADWQEELRSEIGEEDWTVVSKAALLAAGYVSAEGRASVLDNPVGPIKETEALVSAFDPTTIPSGSVLVDGVVTGIQKWFAQSGGERPWDVGAVGVRDRRRVEALVSAGLQSALRALAGVSAD